MSRLAISGNYIDLAQVVYIEEYKHMSTEGKAFWSLIALLGTKENARLISKVFPMPLIISSQL